MDEVIPGLWIGDLPSALDVKTLKDNKIFSILSAMRGRITINETFIRHQIMLDDTEDADVLIHFLPSISFIEAELDKGRGVLVHCQAGMSRSATIVAAFLMYTQNIDPTTALELIRKARPNIQPNDGFMTQLDVFYKASFKISRRDKVTRMFYLERAVEEVMNGDGSLPDTDMFAKYPRTPTDSTPNTPGGPRRRIRCKMCRQELAAREHMLDHGQLGPSTPAISFSPVSSRRPSMHAAPSDKPTSRRLSGSSVLNPMTPMTSLSPSSNTGPQPPSRRASSSSATQSITQPTSRSRLGSSNATDSRPRRSSLLAFGMRGLSDTLSMSALATDASNEVVIESDSDDEEIPVDPEHDQDTSTSAHTAVSTPLSIERAMLLGRRLSNTMTGSAAETTEAISGKGIDANKHENMKDVLDYDSERTSGPGTATTEINNAAISHSMPPPSANAQSNAYFTPADLAAQLHSNPKLAGLRAGMGMTPVQTNTSVLSNAGSGGTVRSPASPPILVNPKCSGYFVEPMKWMESFLEQGQLAGKIVCPNKKCNAKLGNYDWAGVRCACKEWVTPLFQSD